MSANPYDLVGSGIGGVFNYLGAKKQADAIKDAAATQQQSTQQALDFTKQQYADVTGRLKPYVDAGATATDRMSQLLGASPYLTAFRQPQQFQAPPAGAPSTGKLVTVRAPDGSTKQFAAGDPIIARAQQAGATVVPDGPTPVGSGYSPAALAARQAVA